MTRQNDADNEAREEKRLRALGRAVDTELARAVSRAGGQLVGLTLKGGEFDSLMVIKADFPAGRMVSFVGASDWAGCFLKAVREAESDGLRWREDRFYGK